MPYILNFLKEQPFILLFLVVGTGFLVARFKVPGINLGATTATLVFGLLISMWAARFANVYFDVPYGFQILFFNLYIFCVGMRIGPQCFAGLERNGKKFAGVALSQLFAAGALAVLCGWYFQLDAGTLAGVVAGANTASGSFGAAKSAASRGEAGPNGEALALSLSVSFTIAYALSLVAFNFALPLLPRLTKSDADSAAKQADKEIGGAKAPLPQTPEALRSDYQPIDIRAYRIEKPRTVGRAVDDLKLLHPKVSIERVRRGGRLMPVEGNLVLQLGDEIALGGRIEQQRQILQEVGPEVDVPELLDFQPTTAEVVITQNTLVGQTLDQLMRGAAHGLFLNAAFRMGEEIPLDPETQFKRGDVLRVTGSNARINEFAVAVGNLVRSSSTIDLLTLSAGLVIGATLGAIALHVGMIRLGIGTAGGLLVVGVLLSWIRTRYPLFGGPVPEPARKLLEEFGLSIFVATVGITAGHGITRAMSSGLVMPLIMTTIVVGFVPPMIAWLLGISLFRLNAALLLGAVAGARQNSLGLKIAEDAINSSTPAIGFAVPYTLATVVFTFYGYLLMVLWPIK